MPNRAITANYFNRIKTRFCSKKYFQNKFRFGGTAVIDVCGTVIQSIEISREIQFVKEIELIPITHRNTEGDLYQRSPEVESQIREALTLDRQKLIERANRKDYTARNYLQEESLVYLIRDFRIRGAGDVADKLMSALTDRCKKKIDSTLRELLTQEFINECFEEVINDVIWQILDTNSDASNFAETKFWVWLRYRIYNVRRKYLRFQKKNAQTVNYDEHFGKTKTDIGNALEKKDRLQKAVKILTPKERQLYFMRYDLEWQIYNKDQSVNTISNFFGVTARTVQEWFEQAEEKLRRNGIKK